MRWYVLFGLATAVALALGACGSGSINHISAGGGAFATTTAHGFITNAFTFGNDPSALAAAREALGERLHRRVHP